MYKVAVKQRIINAASRLFYFNGYNQTGINQIIAEAGVAKASLYQHFRSKQEVAVAYLEQHHNQWILDLNKHVAQFNDPIDKALGCFDYVLQRLNNLEFQGCAWQNIITDLPDNHQGVKEQVAFHKKSVLNWLETRLTESNTYTSQQITDLANQLLLLLEGALILAKIQHDEAPVRMAKKAFQKLLVV